MTRPFKTVLSYAATIANYPPPPAVVPVEILGDYLRAWRLVIIRHYLDARGRLVLECLPMPPISTDIDPESENEE